MGTGRHAGTGDGTVTLTMVPGHYFAHVVNGSTVSPVVYFVVTSGAESIYRQITEAIQARLRLLTLDGIVSASIVIREIRTDRDVTLPGVVISYDKTTENLKAGTLSMDDVIYAVNVDFFAADNQGHDAQGQEDRKDATYTLWLQKAARAFRNQRLPGVVGVWCSGIQAGPAIDRDAWIANKFVGALRLSFTSREGRGLS